MSQICFYVMMRDTGFAPNPFHDWCTLFGCTPNKVDAQLARGDYIVGVFKSRKPPRLVYIMEVSETLEYDDYYNDRRFDKKKPRRNGTWQERAGNNIYYLDGSGEYAQDPNACFHTTNARIKQDKQHPVVFAGRNFAYFGELAETEASLLLPTRFHWCVPGRGIKYLIDESPDYDPFVSWAFSHGSGIIGLPRDRETDSSTSRRGTCRPVCDDDLMED